MVPPGVVTATFLALIVAVAEIVKVAVIVVGFTTVTPLPETTTVVPVVVKLVPVNVRGTAVPRKPVFGETESKVGGGGLTTVSAKV